MVIPSNPVQPGTTISGKISWFGGPNDPTDSGHTASGGTTATPGIAVYNRATLGGYWLVQAPNGRQAVVQQTDLGPAPFTNRVIDFTYSSLPHFGYTQGNFPTDSVAKATYLGRTIPSQYQHLAPQASSAPRMAAPQGAAPPQMVQQQGFDQQGFQQAQRAAIAGRFLSQTSRSNPWDTGAKSDATGGVNLFGPGLLSTTAPNPADYQTSRLVQAAHNSLQATAGNANLAVHPAATGAYRGYVNPIRGFTVGRTDQGVDASAPVGTPIRAIGDSQLVQTQANWYNGQPLLLFKFLNGPKAGQYWYVAEQISPKVRQGQVVHAGDTVATYAPSGTGIEIGYGSPKSGGLTLAQAQGNTGDASHNNAPAGIAFRQLLGQLGAR